VQKGEQKMKRIVVILVTSILFCISAEARPVRSWSAKELCEKSEVVVLATPVTIDKMNETFDIRLDNNPPLPVVICKAKLAVQYVIKGESLKTLEFRYSPLDPTKLSEKGIVNGPLRIQLEKNAVYVFYLKKEKKKDQVFFVGVLEGDFDDAQGAVLVAPPGIKPATPADAAKPHR
jgi:hypothetical protein